MNMMSFLSCSRSSFLSRGVTPHWEIRPLGAVSETVLLRLGSDGIGTAHKSAAQVTFVAFPAPERVEPNEGPVEGGTTVRVHGRHFRPNGEVGVG